MAYNLIQINLNRAKQAQDVLIQRMQEWDSALAIITESHRIPMNQDWVGDRSGVVAVHSKEGNIQCVEQGMASQ